jgi:hypothetical protein
VFNAKHGDKLIDQFDSFLCISVPLFAKQCPANREGNTFMNNRQDKKINRKTSEHPIGAIQ